MGYYDEFHEYRDEPKRKRGRGWLHSLAGAIIGGLLVLLFLPFLNQWGYLKLPPADSIAPPKSSSQSTLPDNLVRTVNVDVNTDVSKAVADVEDSVVGVVNLQREQDFWARKTEVIQSGTGSGVIFDRDGDTVFIVTNNHVIEGAAEIEVVLASGERVIAAVKGADPLTDLAVLTITAPDRNVTPVDLGNSDLLKAGEPAIAIGNPLGLDYSRTVTVGVISSTQRSIPQDVDGDGASDWEMDVIQTDAAINPGNSGGALINIAGQLIGINSAKISEVGIEGMGFAIPINDAKPIISDLLQYGAVKRPYLGIGPKDLQEIDVYHWSKTLNLPADVHTGVVVIDVAPSGPAAKGGLKELDVIVKLDETAVQSSADLRKYLYKEKNIGDPIKVSFYRDGKLMDTTFTLTEMKY